ncbi:hypothetical protein OH77DRAFT_1076451 [Trametes cingulata]|nr:hypothetical protein OH77DRAFT_1076451 [Trametes cingulata]
MPRLDAVVIKGTHNLGVPCLVLKAILRAPLLESFRLAEPLVRQEFLGSDDLQFQITPSLRHFSYINTDYYRLHPRRSQVEVHLVQAVLEEASDSLETLILPSEPTLSFDRFAWRSWRALRVLSLTGERPSQIPGQPLISTLSHMRCLRTLVLDFASRHGAVPEPIWPAELDGDFPWPDLQFLSIAFPHPDDQIYSHLPPSVSALRLCCWPRHYIHQSWPELRTSAVLRWDSPVLGASELQRILQRCASPHLYELDIEYKCDGEEMRLLAVLPRAFPYLTSFTLYRYRMSDAHIVDVAGLARILAAFKRLRVLRVHLDFVSQPHPLFTVHSPASLSRMREAFAKYADIFASALAESARVVCFLDRQTAYNKWYPFRIVADSGDHRTAQLDWSVAEEYGIRFVVLLLSTSLASLM